MKSLILVAVSIMFFANLVYAQEGSEKEEIRLEEKKEGEKKVQGKDKKVSVFEIVNKLLVVEVKTEGKKFTKEQKAETSGKIESNIKDCVAKVLMAKEEYQKKDKKLFDSDSVVRIKVTGGTFESIKIQKSKTKSPFMKECISSLREFETGYNVNTELTVKVKTRIK